MKIGTLTTPQRPDRAALAKYNAAFNFGDTNAGTAAVAHLSAVQVSQWINAIHLRAVTTEMSRIIGNNKAGVFAALLARKRVIEAQGRVKKDYDVSDEFTAAAVHVEMSDTSDPLTVVKGGRDVAFTSHAGCASHESEPLDPNARYRKEIARRLIGMVTADKHGNVHAAVTHMPRILLNINFADVCASLAQTFAGGLLDGVHAVSSVSSVAEKVAAHIYAHSPLIYGDHTSVVGGRTIIDKSAVIDYPHPKSEMQMKARIKSQLTVAPGSGSGAGQLASSHLDGLTLSRSMREKLEKYQDYVHRDADIYILQGGSEILYHAIYVQIKAIKKGRPFAVMYNGKFPVKATLMASSFEMKHGIITKVLNQSFFGFQNVPASLDLIVYCCDFSFPMMVSAKTMNTELEEARREFHAKRTLGQSRYTFYGCYASYQVVVCKEKFRDGENFGATDKAIWVEEDYYPSTRARDGYCFTLNGRQDDTPPPLSGMAVLGLMHDTKIHSIAYILLGQVRRKYRAYNYPLTFDVDFRTESTLIAMARATDSKLTSLTGKLGDALAEVRSRYITDIPEEDPQQFTPTPTFVVTPTAVTAEEEIPPVEIPKMQFHTVMPTYTVPSSTVQTTPPPVTPTDTPSQAQTDIIKDTEQLKALFGGI